MVLSGLCFIKLKKFYKLDQDYIGYSHFMSPSTITIIIAKTIVSVVIITFPHIFFLIVLYSLVFSQVSS